MFGFGKGKVTVQLEKYAFSQGETITGKVSVRMKKAVQANELVVNLMGQETTTGRGGGQSSSSTRTICDQSVTVEGSRPYSAGEVVEKSFSIPIPKVQLPKVEFKNNALNTVARFAQAAATANRRQKWWLRARLDVPGLDVRSRRAKIVVTSSSVEAGAVKQAAGDI